MTAVNRVPPLSSPREHAEASASGWQELRKRLDELAQALHDAGIGELDRLEQIAQLLYLNRLDEREPEDGSKIFPGVMTSRFRWSRLRALPGIDLQRILGDAYAYLSSLVHEAPAVADYYRDATLKIEDPNALERIVRLIDGIDFERLRPDEIGKILEYLIAETNPSGDFRTPHHVRDLMVKLVDPSAGESIYDPACGTGGFLTDAVMHLIAKLSKEEGAQLDLLRRGLGRFIHGHDISRRMIRIAAMNLELQGIGPVNLRRTNSLTASGAGVTPEEMARKFDVVLCAPAFGNAPSGEPMRPDLPIQSTRSEILFLEVAMESLMPGGRGAIIVPESLLSASGSTFVEVRRRLLSNYQVHAIISLPPTAFRLVSAVKTSIIVFQRPDKARPSGNAFKGTRRVWFYEVRHDGYDLERREQSGQDDIPDLFTTWERFRMSGYMQPPGLESRSVDDADADPRYWWTKRETIEENGFELSAQRYKPRPAFSSSVTTTAQLALLGGVQEAFVHSVETLRDQIRSFGSVRGWTEHADRAKLEALVNVERGTTPSTKEAAYWDGAISWASPTDVKSHILRETKRHVTPAALKKYKLTIFEPPVVLMVVRGMSLANRVPLAVTTIPVAISQDLRALRPGPQLGFDAWYLFAYLKSIEDLLLASTQGTTHGSRALSPQFVRDFVVPVPPPHVREQIGRTAHTYVMLAEHAEAMMEVAGGLFPPLLGDMLGRQGDAKATRDNKEGDK